MSKVLIHLRGVKVYSHSALLYAGTVLGLTAGNMAANAAHLDPLRVLVAQLLLLIVGLVGARLLHLFIERDYYRANMHLIWDRAAGGASQLGGLLLMLPASAIVLKPMSVPLGPFWDVSAITLLTGVMVGKWGCLLNGCCGGRAVDWRLAPLLPDHRGVHRWRVPTQLLESLLAAMALAGAVLLSVLDLPPGTVFLGALLAYSLGRFLLQPTRETRDRLGPIDIQQALAALLAVVAVTGLAVATGPQGSAAVAAVPWAVSF